MCSTLVLEDDLQNISNSGTSIAHEDDLESLNSENAGFDLEHDEYELSSSEESEDESDNKGRISPEPDCNDHNFDLFSEKEEPCLLVVQVLEPYIPIRSFSLITRHRGFRDNIDKTVHRRYLHLDQQNLSLHTYAIENHIDFTGLSDKRNTYMITLVLMTNNLWLYPFCQRHKMIN